MLDFKSSQDSKASMSEAQSLISPAPGCEICEVGVPLTYRCSKARTTPDLHCHGLLCFASSPGPEQPGAAGQRTNPSGASEGLAGAVERYLPPSSPPDGRPGDAYGPRHTL